MAKADDRRPGSLLGLDARSLGLFRLGLGGCVSYDALTRLSGWFAHYSDGGIASRDTVLQLAPDVWRGSLYFLSGSGAWALTLLVAQGVLGLFLAVGVRTRLTTLACWLLVISVQARNPLVTHGGDDVLRMLLFWSLFLPLGARFSVDETRAERALPGDETRFGVGTVGYLLQLIILYASAGLAKNDPIWVREGLGVYYALHLDWLTTWFGDWLRTQLPLLKVLNYGTLLLEVVGPLALLSPFGAQRVRLVLPLAFISLHLGLLLSMHLEMFPVVGMVAWLAVLPALFWSGAAGLVLERRLVAARDRFARLFAPLAAASAPTTTTLPRWAQGVAAVALPCVLLQGFETIQERDLEVPTPVNAFRHALQLEADWALFAPYPSKDDGWYVIPSKSADGVELDLYTSAAVSWNKPADVSDHYRDARWSKLLQRLYERDYVAWRLHYGRYLCRLNNVERPRERAIETFSIVYVLEETPPPGGVMEHQRVVLWEHSCF